jgi:hypothetical protein
MFFAISSCFNYDYCCYCSSTKSLSRAGIRYIYMLSWTIDVCAAIIMQSYDVDSELYELVSDIVLENLFHLFCYSCVVLLYHNRR